MIISKSLEFTLRNDIDVINGKIKACSIEILNSKSKSFIVPDLYRSPETNVNILKNYCKEKK